MKFTKGNWFAVLRWKIYRLSMLLSLGRVGGWGLYLKVIYRICDNFEQVVQSHVRSFRLIAPARVEHFHYQETYGGHMRSEAALPSRYLYFLSDVAISPNSGAMWIPGERILIESLGTNMEFFDLGGMVDVLRKPKAVTDDVPVVPCPSLSYYHWFLIALPQILIAREELKGRLRVAVPDLAARYVNSALEFLGFDESLLIRGHRPLVVKNTCLVARNVDAGVVFREDIAALRRAILPKVSVPNVRTRKVYISRRLESNRAVINEGEVEDLMRKFGFDICYFEKMTLREQMQVVVEAKVIAGIHGAGLANIVMGQDGLAVIEVLNPDWFNPCFAQLTQQLGFAYHSLLLKKTEKGLEVPLEALASCVQATV